MDGDLAKADGTLRQNFFGTLPETPAHAFVDVSWRRLMEQGVQRSAAAEPAKA
ncbi:MAG: hypothetical protein HXY29_12780 [Rhodocyclaceae bacterium]|nr:hypothetical protein [Rhodocyclaceae bacterium]